MVHEGSTAKQASKPMRERHNNNNNDNAGNWKVETNR